MVTLERYVNRTFTLKPGRDGSKIGLKQYHAFAHGSRPVWWTEEVPFASTSFGVYENVPGQRNQALLFSEEQLAVLTSDGASYVRFADIERLVLPVKRPVSLSLSVVLRAEARFEIPAFAPVGVAFDLYRLLLRATQMVRRRNPSAGTPRGTEPA
ncbi:hypothetical protein [Pyxidicoccus caerfyrddinensis]|uniref:hypothetical protein n=1 Tax=Pyxidicoccus caerfyrddinensis TaxID=2709663 RepID=UPI0013DC862B|nr:hypothetical protein [Pyxidicoccus caerfyrddinensis]